MKTNLPQPITPSKTDVAQYFEKQFTPSNSYPSNEIDAVIGFFTKRGFDIMASQATAIILLQYARNNNMVIFELLDSLNGITNVQLSMIVTEILNNNRAKCSTLGYKHYATIEDFERRNIFI